MLLSQAAEALGERLKEQARAMLDDNRIVPWTPDGPMFPAPRNEAPLGLEDGPAGWTYTRPDEPIAEAAKRYVGADEDAAHAAAWSDHQLVADPPDFRVVPLGAGFVPAEMQKVQGAPTWFISAAFYAAEERRAELEALGDADSLRAVAEVEPRRLDAAEARAEAWRRWHGDNAEVTHDMLLLAGEWESDPADDASKAARIAWILGWSLRERGRVGVWAAAVHVNLAIWRALKDIPGEDPRHVQMRETAARELYELQVWHRRA